MNSESEIVGGVRRGQHATVGGGGVPSNRVRRMSEVPDLGARVVPQSRRNPVPGAAVPDEQRVLDDHRGPVAGGRAPPRWVAAL